MKDDKNAAFAGSTVMSTRKASGIEGVILRRRIAPDGRRFTTAEVDESMLELLLVTPGGLKRRNTAINTDSIAKAVELYNSGKSRVEAEKELGVSSGTYRRLLAAGGVETRKYNAILTPENVKQALRVTAHYDLRKRGDVIKAAKEMGVNSRTIRRLLTTALETMTMEEIAVIRKEALAQRDAESGQKSIEAANVPAAAPAVAEAPAPAAGAPVPITVMVPPGAHINVVRDENGQPVQAVQASGAAADGVVTSAPLAALDALLTA